MYQEFFNLTRRPFSQVPSASGCVMLPGLRSELDRNCAAIEQLRGPALIVAPSGCGKTTLLSLIENHFADQLRTVTLGCAAIENRAQLIQSILFEMNLPFDSENVGQLRLSMIDHFKSEEHCPGGLLLLVDEAHNLDRHVLEELRMITNLVCAGRTQVRLVIAGDPGLEENMSRLESFSQRIGVRSYLAPMTQTETMLFVLAQLQMCGRDGRDMFQPTALQKLHDITGGVHRVVCQVCDTALEMAARQGANVLSANDIERAWCDLQQLPAPADAGEPGLESSGAAAGSAVEFGSLNDEPDASPVADSIPMNPEPEPEMGAPIPSLSEPPVNDLSPGEPAMSEPAMPEPADDDSMMVSGSLEMTASVESTLDNLLDQLGDIDGQGPPDAASAPAAASTTLDGDLAAPPEQALPTTPDAGELFGAGFDQEERVVDVQGRQLADQNRASAGTRSEDLADLNAGVDSPAWLADGPEIQFPVLPTDDLRESDDPDLSISESTATPLDLQQITGDDRDMLILDQPESVQLPADSRPPVPPPPSGSEPERDQEEQMPPAAGQVIRMDYEDLFRQLRDENPGASQP